MTGPDEKAPLTAGATGGERAALTRLIVICPSQLARSFMVAGLADAPGLWVETCANPAEHAGPPPDVLLLQDIDAGAGDLWLAHQLHSARQHWPHAKVMLLAASSGARLRLCRAMRVHGCLPAQASVDQVIAAIQIIRADLIIYPARLLDEPDDAAPTSPSQGDHRRPNGEG